MKPISVEVWDHRGNKTRIKKLGYLDRKNKESGATYPSILAPTHEEYI
jgi:hypothetical protein